MLSLNPLTRKLWVFKKAFQGENGFRAYNFRTSLGNALQMVNCKIFSNEIGALIFDLSL